MDQSVAMLRTMAAMQNEHNCQVHPEWQTQGYAYYRAIWVECAEMLDHFGWKWWKAQSPDIDQVKLELVDIWHFALSEMLRADTLTDDMAATLAAAEPLETPDAERFRVSIEALAQDNLMTQTFSLPPFVDAMCALPMSYTELFDLYIGKNVLNRFRQDHGYKAGTYIKVWHGREDNEHLIEALAMLDTPAAELPDALYAALSERYPG